jgi:hypothetical protein
MKPGTIVYAGRNNTYRNIEGEQPTKKPENFDRDSLSKFANRYRGTYIDSRDIMKMKESEINAFNGKYKFRCAFGHDFDNSIATIEKEKYFCPFCEIASIIKNSDMFTFIMSVLTAGSPTLFDNSDEYTAYDCGIDKMKTNEFTREHTCIFSIQKTKILNRGITIATQKLYEKVRKANKVLFEIPDSINPFKIAREMMEKLGIVTNKQATINKINRTLIEKFKLLDIYYVTELLFNHILFPDKVPAIQDDIYHLYQTPEVPVDFAWKFNDISDSSITQESLLTRSGKKTVKCINLNIAITSIEELVTVVLNYIKSISSEMKFGDFNRLINDLWQLVNKLVKK